MTTRRLRPEGPPPRGRMGRLGLFGPLAMSSAVSVEARERRIDGHGLPQHAVERAPRRGPFEAREPPARVDTAPGQEPPRRERAVDGREADQLPLRRLRTAAGARAD